MNEYGQRITQTDYDDENRKITVNKDLIAGGDGKLQTVTHYDELGRVVFVQKSDGTPINNNSDGIKVKTKYIPPRLNPDHTVINPRMDIASAPYRSTSFNDTTMEWTCKQYDQNGRVIIVATFKGNTEPTSCESATNRTGLTQTVYDADWTIVTDPAGKVRSREWTRWKNR